MATLLSKTEIESALAARFGPYLRFRDKPAVRLAPTGIAEVDAVAGGLPRGAMTEIFGPPSSGRTSLLLSILAEATARQEVCAVVDTSDSFDPASAAAGGVALDQLLWVRCGGKVNNALKAMDLLLQGGGFGLVVLDLGDIAPQQARRIPLSCWFRFRRVIENTPTIMVAMEQEPCAKSCASLILQMKREWTAWSGLPICSRLLSGARIQVERRKPVQSTTESHSRSATCPAAAGNRKPPGSATFHVRASHVGQASGLSAQAEGPSRFGGNYVRLPLRARPA